MPRARTNTLKVNIRMHDLIFYLAYGSNLHPERMLRRVPSARHLGTAYLEGWSLCFNKLGKDGSAKCNIMPCPGEDNGVYAALYELSKSEKIQLDKAENGYRICHITAKLGGRSYKTFTYVAEVQHIDHSCVPYDWYRDLVLMGAWFNEFPDSYIAHIESFDVAQDRNLERYARNRVILDAIYEQISELS